MYDVIVIGARCAGAATAMLLARAGRRVLLLDRDTFPSDTLSTHYVHQSGVQRLARWGLLGELESTGCPPISRGVAVTEGVRLEGWSDPRHGNAFAPRRQVLDTLLVEAAVRAGADFRDGCSVRELLVEGDQVAGVRYRTPLGVTAQARARLVVGADGVRSAVARFAGACTYDEHPRMTCAYYSYWDVEACFEGYHRGRQSIGVAPTHDGLTMVSAYFPQSEFAVVRTDPLAAYLDLIDRTAPELRERIGGRRPAERLRGTGDQPNWFRTATGPGWALVGDAGHHRDSITGQGITNAWAQADLLADCIVDDDLERFARERDDLLRETYRYTLLAARMDPPEWMVSMLRTVGQSAELTSLYFGMMGGVVDAKELISRLGPIEGPAAA